MANLCTVSYICESCEEQLFELNKTLEFLHDNKAPIEINGWGKMWLGCVIKQLGGDWYDYRCRGLVLDFGFNDNGTLYIEQSTAWCEQNEFREFLEHRFPGLKVYYRQLEPCLNNISTNDVEGRYFPERFYLETHKGFYYFATIEKLAKFVATIIGYKVEPEFGIIYEALDEYLEDQGEESEAFYNLFEISVDSIVQVNRI